MLAMMLSVRGGFGTLLTLAVTALAPQALALDASAKAAVSFTEFCSQCHGMKGEGQAKIAAPTIAGLPEWYVANQLTKFRSGVRGTHPKDVAGIRMYAMARFLREDEDLKAMATHVAAMPAVPQAATLTGGDATRGQAAFAVCAACHGADGAGNQGMNAPRLAGQNDWYVVTQLRHFKAGIRAGDAAQDPIGATMRGMAAPLDDQAMLDLAAYLSTLSR